jgi:signal transduction histidine kinase
VSHELASTFNLKRIYGFIGDTISSALGLKNIYLLSLFPDKTYRMVYLTTYEKKDEIKSEKAVDIGRESSVREYNIENRIQESEGTINGKSEIVKLLKKSNDVVIREELPQIHKISQEVVDKVNTDLKPFKGEAVVPVFIDGKLELMMVLGEKLSGDIFTSEDIKLLHTISDQTAIAVRNARLYIDKLRSDRLASMGMISATFAHEIKNPLTSIKTFAQLLPERHSDTEFRENFSRIVIDGVNRIDGLIKDLLDFSSGKISVEMSTLNVTGLMDNIIDEVVTQLQLKNKKISIEKDYENIEVDMSGDGKRLRQAFANIILNGCQAIPDTRDDGKIRVSINPGEENVGITIADNGDGIPPEDVIRIFEPFFSTKTIGAGLGLAITKKIIEDHYGKIEVDSILKKGTTFRITLPVKRMGAKVGNLSTA